MDKRTARRIAHGLAASHLTVAVDNGELADLLYNDLTEPETEKVLAQVLVLAERHARHAE